MAIWSGDCSEGMNSESMLARSFHYFFADLHRGRILFIGMEGSSGCCLVLEMFEPMWSVLK